MLSIYRGEPAELKRHTPIKPRKASCSALIGAIIVFACSFSVNAGLQIEKAYCGAEDSWCDVTPFLQNYLKRNAVAVSLSQPFAEIGGDPASGQVKKLVVDYRVDGKPFRLLLEEQYPVAFDLTLPSPDAVPPGTDPHASAIMAEAVKNPHMMPLPLLQARPLWQYWNRYGEYLQSCFSIIAIICACAALVQLRQVKKQLRRASNAADVPTNLTNKHES